MGSCCTDNPWPWPTPCIADDIEQCEQSPFALISNPGRACDFARLLVATYGGPGPYPSAQAFADSYASDAAEELALRCRAEAWLSGEAHAPIPVPDEWPIPLPAPKPQPPQTPKPGTPAKGAGLGAALALAGVAAAGAIALAWL